VLACGKSERVVPDISVGRVTILIVRDTMVDLPPLTETPRYYFRFVDSIGFGSCDGCYRIGPVNRLCLDCCVSEGMTLGACFVCHHGGPAWEGCHWCERGRYLAPGYGQCRECDWHGPGGEDCHNCDDGVFAPIPPEDPDDVVLVITTTTDLDSANSDSVVQGVASRTRSRTI
jgi:hypothetical protein